MNSYLSPFKCFCFLICPSLHHIMFLEPTLTLRKLFTQSEMRCVIVMVTRSSASEGMQKA